MLLQLSRSMDSSIYLYGASGHCKVVVDILQENNQNIGAIIDDDPAKKELLGIAVLHSSNLIASCSQKMIIAIGDNAIRKNIVERMSLRFCTAIHPSAVISRYAVIEEGTVVMSSAVINASATIGKHCIINTAAIIEHDCQLADFVHISPNATLSGAVVVKEGAHIGVGACVIQGITIGKWATIGAGAVILSDVPDYATVVGNPGRIIKNKKNE